MSLVQSCLVFLYVHLYMAETLWAIDDVMLYDFVPTETVVWARVEALMLNKDITEQSGAFSFLFRMNLIKTQGT